MGKILVRIFGVFLFLLGIFIFVSGFGVSALYAAVSILTMIAGVIFIVNPNLIIKKS